MRLGKADRRISGNSGVSGRKQCFEIAPFDMYIEDYRNTLDAVFYRKRILR